jgi:hypothetical protein
MVFQHEFIFDAGEALLASYDTIGREGGSGREKRFG